MQTEPTIEPTIEAPASDEAAIRALVTRLSRPHKSGGVVIERAALLAEGSAATAAIRWIEDHHGLPERAVDESASHGLHGPRFSSGHSAGAGKPLRWVLPPGAVG